MIKTRNWHTRAIYLVFALALVAGLSVVPLGNPQAAADPDFASTCGSLAVGHFTGGVDGASAAAWSTTQVHTGTYSAKLTTTNNNLALAAAKVPYGGTLTAFSTIGRTNMIFWMYWDTESVTPYAAIWLDTDADGLADVVLMDQGPAQGTITLATDTWCDTLPHTSNEWHVCDYDAATGLVGLTGTLCDGNTYDITDFNTLAEWAAITCTGGGTFGDAEVLCVGCYFGGLGFQTSTHVAYVDEIIIDGVTYGMEPCYELTPDISMNVKTADETFTVVNACGEAVNGTIVQNWQVTKGEGVGAVTTVAGGTNGDNYITVRMATMGDCIITCDVDYDYDGQGDFAKNVTLYAEKKWGEIDSTELTAWDEDPCDEERPTGASDTEHNRVIDLGTPATSQSVLVQEKVIANFLPGPVPAPAGGAKITWWLLENDDAGLAQAALEDLIERFDTYDYESGELGWGEGCGQYGNWAGDPTFIPETLIDAIYATYGASDTDFVKAECVSIADATKTVTYTDHVWETLGEGLTNVTVEFDEVGSTGYAEPVIVVVLADYPLDKNGENAVCVEYFKFKPTIVIIPEVCQVKVPQVKWAGEKIVLEKDWGSEYAGYLVGFYLEEGCIGNMIPFPLAGETTVLVSGDARTALTAVDSYGVARAMFETEQQGQVDIKCVLYNATFAVGASYQTMQGYGRTSEVIGNHGFLVYYLALEDVTVDEEYSDLENNTANADADVLVKVRGWFTSDALPGTSRPAVLGDDGITYVLPAGRYVLPDDWAALAGSDEATSNLASRPQYDLMNTPGDGVESDYQLGPYDDAVRTTTPPGEADDLVIGPFSTLQPWNCVDALGNPTNMWIADNVVPADYTIATPYTIPRTAADVRNTVVPDATIDEFDCPMPAALVTFDVTDTEVLNELDKGDASGYGVDGDGDYIAPFYAMEIPSNVLIPTGGYHWDSWGGWTAPTTDDGPYNFWDDLGVTPNDDDILEVYSDNHGYAGVTIDGYGLENKCVLLDVIADFPVLAAKYPAVEVVEQVCWGVSEKHLNPDFEADPRTGTAPLDVDFDPSWTSGGTTPYVKAEWDFNGDGTYEITRTGSWATPGAIPTETWTFNFPGTYTIALRITDSTTPSPLVHTETKTGYVVVTGTSNPYDANYNGIIDKSEAVQAVTDYFDGLISKAEVLGIIALYFESAG